MNPLFYSVEERAGAHTYFVSDPQAGADWLASLAKEYVHLRSGFQVPLKEEDIAGLFDGIEDFGKDSLIVQLRRAGIPTTGQGTNFDTLRSDLGELISYHLLGLEFPIQFAYLSIRDRELIERVGRGIDAIGVFDGDPIGLVLSETKVSDEAKSPPRVVDNTDDCLCKQHLAHIGDLGKTSKKVFDSGRRATDKAVRDLFLQAYAYLSSGNLSRIKIVVSSILVRPEKKHKETDFGSFKSNPGQFTPAVVRFWAVRVHANIDAVVQEWRQAIASETLQSGVISE